MARESHLPDEAVIFHGGPIRTLSARQPVAEAVGVRNGRIVAVGGKAEVEARLGASSSGLAARPRLVDLGGATLYPGLVDSHTHFLDFSLFLDFVNLDGVASLDKALEIIAAFAAKLPKGEWVRGGIWNKNLWGDGRFPSRHDLDRVVPDHPVALGSKDMHSWWLNTAGLKLINVTRDTPDVPGGEIERDASGEPTGILKENAALYLWSTIGELGPSQQMASLRKGIAEAHRLGLVGVCGMEGRESLKFYQALDRAGELDFRVWLYVPDAVLTELAAVGVESGFGTPNVRIAGIKSFLDGSLGSQTADMLEPFEGGDGRGIATQTPEAFDALVERASREGVAVSVHAIGDHATRVALDVFDKHQTVWRAAGLRQRIEHLQLLDPADLARAGQLGVIASMQPLHGPSDRGISDRYWGPRRSPYAYAWNSVAAAGSVLAFGSDAPVESIDPLQGLYAAVTRRHPEDPKRAPWYPEQAVTPLAALRAYTAGAAWAVGAEHERGTIEPGMVADFTILSNDILAAGEAAGRATGAAAGEDAGAAILDARVVATVVDGHVVYGEL